MICVFNYSIIVTQKFVSNGPKFVFYLVRDKGPSTRGAISNAGSWIHTSGTMPLTTWAHPENSTIEMLIKRLKLHTLLSYLVSMYENFEHSQPK